MSDIPKTIKGETADYRDQVADILDSLPDHKTIDFHSCCMAAAVYGPARCTCWTHEYDREQQPPTGVMPPDIIKCCNDCAFRSDSPERSAESNHACSAGVEGELPDIPANGFFFCHKGMRKVIAAVHGPTGLRVEFTHGDHYEPPQYRQRLILANGDYAPLCAGYASTRRTTTAKAHAKIEKQIALRNFAS